MTQYNSVQDIFDQWALSGRAEQMVRGHAFAVQHILQNLPQTRPFQFLDIGCGTGWVVSMAASLKICQGATGIDISKEMIEKAQSNLAQENYIHSDFMDWQPNRSFDVIFLMESLYYFKDINKALSKIYSCLNPNGIILFGTDYYQENPVSKDWQQELNLPMRYLSQSTWEEHFQQAGFKSIETRQIKEPDAQETWKQEFGTLFIKASK